MLIWKGSIGLKACENLPSVEMRLSVKSLDSSISAPVVKPRSVSWDSQGIPWSIAH